MATYGAAQLAASFQTVRKNTIQIAEEIPEEQYGVAPSEGLRTVAQQLVHIAVAPRIWAALADSGVSTLVGFDFMSLFLANMAEEQKPRTKAEVVALLQTEGDAFATLLGGLSDEFLAGELVQPDGVAVKSRLETMMAPKEHEMHHRGQLMLQQRMFGITPHLTRQMMERFAAMKK